VKNIEEPPKSNLSKEERAALKNLRNDENLVILKADKGGATVLMNLNDYNKKMNEHLTRVAAIGNLIATPLRKL
jgi:hypothetical protein